MASISWLHLTDLHCGMQGQAVRWPDVKEALFDDLERLHTKSGPWDLVLFTGDLTQRGSTEEFAELRKRLDKLWARFGELGSAPMLVMVPGNHDLVRPDATEATAALGGWHDRHELRDQFWVDATCPGRRLVRETFGPYVAFERQWRVAHPPPNNFKDFTLTQGILPGEASISFEKDGLRVALVGLNTAFLHLWGGELSGTLALEREQLREVCGDDPPEWLASHDLALLLTHHPQDWLAPRAKAIVDESILARDRFFAHLYGHMHEARMVRETTGDSPERRRIQGPSLFGLEHYGTTDETRVHGYMAGRVSVKEGGGDFHLWPRHAIKTHAGAYKIVPEQALDLTDEAIAGSFVPRRSLAPPALSGPSRAASTSLPGTASNAPSPAELRAALCRYFDQTARIRMLLNDAGVTLVRIHWAQAVETLWDEVLQETTRAGRLPRLMQLAAEEYPASAELAALAARLKG